MRRIQVQIKTAVRVAPADDKAVGFISYCHALDVYSQGPTEQKAIENLKEAVHLFISSCLDRGTFDQILRKEGFELDTAETQDPDEVMLDVPIALVARTSVHV